jgi:5-methylcytosine-specific restriction endonuclease McrA
MRSNTYFKKKYGTLEERRKNIAIQQKVKNIRASLGESTNLLSFAESKKYLERYNHKHFIPNAPDLIKDFLDNGGAVQKLPEKHKFAPRVPAPRKKNKLYEKILAKEPPKTYPPSFYTSDAWRALRYEAFKLYGQKCCVCGAIPKSGAVLHVDHIKPRSLYPVLELDIDNLQILCEACNMGKSNRDSIDWRP